jgi:photosystem II stability/assembly factor-like uncharacterized protein
MSLSLLIAISAVSAAAPQSLTEISPRGRDARVISASTRNPLLSTLALDDGRVLASYDGAQSYETSGLPVISDLIELDWDAGGFAYVASAESVWVSSDGVQSWIERDFPGTITRFAASRANPQEIWATSTAGQLARSTDAGGSWTLSDLPTEVSVPAGISTESGVDSRLVLWAGPYVAVTNDAGGTWTLGFPDFLQILSVADDGEEIVLHAYYQGVIPGFLEIWASSDSAATWNLVATLGQSHNQGRMFSDLAAGGALYFSHSQFGIELSTDQGRTWSSLRSSRFSGSGIQRVTLQSMSFTAGTSRTPLAVSSVGVVKIDGWDQPMQQATGDMQALPAIKVARNPVDESHLVTSVGAMGFESFDDGQSWSELSPLIDTAISEVQFDRAGDLHVVAGGFEVLRREAGTWADLELNERIDRIEIGRSNPNLLVSLTAPVVGIDSFLHYSLDRGASWTSKPLCDGFNCRLAPRNLEIIERPGHPLRIAAVWGVARVTLAYTDDLGDTWQEVLDLNAFQLAAPVISIAQSATTPGLLAVGFTDGRPVHITTDGLETLAPLAADSGGATVLDVAIGASASDLVVRAIREDNTERIEESRDGGGTWELQIEGASGVGDLPAIGNVSLDGVRYEMASSFGVYSRATQSKISQLECEQTSPNSSGFRARLEASGSNVVTDNSVRLALTQLPPSAASLVIVAPRAGFTPNAGGSLGDLCLSGPIGRMPVIQASASGVAFQSVDPAQLPQPNGSVPALGGSTWYFQTWHRDVVSGQSASHFSNSISVLWQ